MAAAGRHRGRRGHTLIELAIAIATAGVVSLLAGSILVEGSSVMTRATKRAAIADSAGRTMEQILRYVREVSQDVALTGLAQISTADASTLRFGNNGFRLTGTTLEMTIDGGTTWYRACPEVSGLTFSYFDKNGTALTSLPLSASARESVRQIQVELQLTSVGQTHRIRSLVYLRNFMNEAAS